MSTKFRIEVPNFTKNYKNKQISFENIVISHKVTMLIGENGCGKSTLIKGILDIISYEGEIINDNKLSYMPEHFTFPHDITVNCFLTNLGHLSKSDNDFLDICAEFNILEKIDEKISNLSKGMKSKLNLIQALALEADVYILDEPLSGLDKEAVAELVKYINKSDKQYIISSHIETAFNDIEKEVILL